MFIENLITVIDEFINDHTHCLCIELQRSIDWIRLILVYDFISFAFFKFHLRVLLDILSTFVNKFCILPSIYL